MLLGFSATYKGKNIELGRENTLIGTACVTFTKHTQRCFKRKGDGYLLFTKMALREVGPGRNMNTTQREMGPGRHIPNQREWDLGYTGTPKRKVRPGIHRNNQRLSGT